MFRKKHLKNFGKLIKGTYGNDDIMGSDKNDIIIGKAGDDKLNGWCGNDIIFGNKGNDTIFGADGNDYVFGGKDNDTIYGGRGNDKLFGNAGDDKIKGENGNDLIFGGLGFDNLYGGEGNDKLFGGKDNDRLFGDAGNDFLEGGNDNDFLYGGTGNDKYSFNCNFGCDTIYDEDGKFDKIDFNTIKHTKLAFLKNGDDLIIGYNDNKVKIKKMFVSSGNHTIESIEARGNYHLDINAINEIISTIAGYSQENGINFTNIAQVQDDNNLMNLISNSWIS